MDFLSDFPILTILYSHTHLCHPSFPSPLICNVCPSCTSIYRTPTHDSLTSFVQYHPPTLSVSVFPIQFYDPSVIGKMNAVMIVICDFVKTRPTRSDFGHVTRHHLISYVLQRHVQVDEGKVQFRERNSIISHYLSRVGDHDLLPYGDHDSTRCLGSSDEVSARNPTDTCFNR